jgi:hypothetical protein
MSSPIEHVGRSFCQSISSLENSVSTSALCALPLVQVVWPSSSPRDRCLDDPSDEQRGPLEVHSCGRITAILKDMVPQPHPYPPFHATTTDDYGGFASDCV